MKKSLVFFLLFMTITLVTLLMAAEYANPISPVFEQTVPSQQINPMAPNISVQNQEPTADWKTYVNSRDGYSLKYPNDWVLNDHSQVGPPDAYGTTIKILNKYGLAIYNFGNVNETDYKNLSTLENAYKNISYTFDPPQILNIDGHFATLYVVKNPKDVEMGYPVDVTIKAGNKVIGVMGFLNDPKDKEQFVDQFKQIVGTLKFTK